MALSRVCIRTDDGGDPVSVDVALPAGAPVGELLPAIVDLVDGRVSPDGAAHRWRLDSLTAGPLDESLSLQDNGIDDGALLTLRRDHAPAPWPARVEPCHAAAEARPWDGNAGVTLDGPLCVLAAALASVTLASTAGSAEATTNAVVAAVGACAAAAATIASGHRSAPGVAVACLAGAAGFLAVPSEPSAPNAFLAAAAGFSGSSLMLRLSGRASPVLIATAALCLLVALVTVVAMPVVAVGAALSAGSLGFLALAPRLSVVAARLGPHHWHDAGVERAETGHAVLSGLVVGGAAGSASGAALVAATGATTGAIAFTALTGVVLVLGARTWVDGERRICLVAAGSVCGVAALATVAVDRPEYLGPVCGALVVAGLVAVRTPRTGATTARLLDLLEYAARAAVVPAACWVGGVYALVGGFHLS